MDCSARAKLTDGLMVCPCALWHCIRSPYPSPVHWRSRLCAGTGRRSPYRLTEPCAEHGVNLILNLRSFCDIRVDPGPAPRVGILSFVRGSRREETVCRCRFTPLHRRDRSTADAGTRPRGPAPPRSRSGLTDVLSPDSALKRTPFPLSEPKNRKTQRSAPPGIHVPVPSAGDSVDLGTLRTQPTPTAVR